jgi:hypothetical protein
MAASSFQNLHGKLAQQAKTDHRNSVAQLHIRCADAVQGNAAKSREGSFVEGNGRGLWKFCYQQARHASYFRVNCVTGARTRHAIADENVGYTFPNAYHSACTAVSQRRRLVQAAADRLHGREQALATNLANYFPHQVGPRLGLLKQVLSSEL